MSLKLRYDPNSKKKMFVKFSNGNPVNKSELICKLFQVDKEKNQQILFVKGENINYMGNNFGGRRHQPYCKYALAKINKKTSEAKLYDTDFFELKPILNDTLKVDSQVNNSSKKTYKEKQLDLLNAFGSKLVRKTHNVSVAVDNSSMDDVLKVMSKPDFVLHEEENASPDVLIPHNKSATCVEEIYPLYDIIPQSVLQSVANKAKQFMQPTPQDYLNWQNDSGAISSEYVQNYISRLNSLNEKDAFESFLVLQVIVYLIDLGNLQRGSAKKKCLDLLPHVSSQFNHWVKEKFFDSGKSTHQKQLISRSNKDVLHATVIILAWHLDGFSSVLKLIRTPISVSTARFRKIVEALGGEIQGTQARLKFPLSFIGDRITGTKSRRK